MPTIVDRALRLWSEPIPEGDAGLVAFRTVYADPVEVNGVSTSLQVLVDRGRMMQEALAGLAHHVYERFDGPGRRAFAFQISGRLVGPLTTPLGDVAPTGQDVQIAGIDLFVVDEDAELVTGVWAVADHLGLLMQTAAIELVDPAT